MTKNARAKRIRVIVTGGMERRALEPSVKAWFPPRTVKDDLVEWSTAPMLDGATTHRLGPQDPPNSTMMTLARALVAEVWLGEYGTPADMVVVIDDLELNNIDQPATVCAHFREAIERDIARRNLDKSTEWSLRTCLRERGSFHLMSPMIEAYLFGEPAALVRAGCAPDVEPLLVDRDVEAFEAQDPAWMPTCEAVNASKRASHPWWREERHAKHYLTHLIERNGKIYRETREGVAALIALNWPGVPADVTSMALMRALFEDLADFFGVLSPLGQGQVSPVTYVGQRIKLKERESLLLRNMWRDLG